MITQLAGLKPGTRFQLYKRQRDGSRRTPFMWSRRELNGVELTVQEVHKSYVLVSLPDSTRVPLSGSLRIREVAHVGGKKRPCF